MVHPFKLFLIAVIVILTFVMLLLGCRYTVPVDGTPAWDKNNRYGQELINDCNTTTHSIGITGCAFYDGAVGGNITFPSFYNGDLSLVSYNCSNIKVQATRDADNIFQVKDLYNATNSQSCSFKTTRTVKEGDVIFDRTIMGRIFIKILPANYLYQKLKFQIGNNTFSGIGWHAKKTNGLWFTNNPEITAYPSGKEGTLKVYCGEELIKELPYKSSPFKFIIEDNVSCDYELFLKNTDSQKVDLATLVQEVQGNTLDIAEPTVWISSRNHFKVQFNDSSIVGVQIEDTKCIPANDCKVDNLLTSYIIKAASSNGRIFWGKYDTTQSKFVEVK